MTAIYFGLLPFSEMHFLGSVSGNAFLAGNVIYGLWPHGLYSSGCLLLLVTSAQDPDTRDSHKHLKGLKEGIFLAGNSVTNPCKVITRCSRGASWPGFLWKRDSSMALLLRPFSGIGGGGGAQTVAVTQQDLVT